MTDLPNASAGINRPCPVCDAAPDEPCRNRFGGTRVTTHQERKK